MAYDVEDEPFPPGLFCHGCAPVPDWLGDGLAKSVSDMCLILPLIGLAAKQNCASAEAPHSLSSSDGTNVTELPSRTIA
jgi:hypothetical protein